MVVIDDDGSEVACRIESNASRLSKTPNTD